jgi:outer membrane protein TolC
LFTGFARTAARSQSTIEVDRLTIERDAIDRSVSQQIRAALHQAGASWADIAQTRAAAEAAARNLDLVTDAYARGAVSIVTLLDAQQASLGAELSAANAVYAFLFDLMTAERAVGEFSFFRSTEERRAFVVRLDAFYRQAGVSPARR